MTTTAAAVSYDIKKTEVRELPIPEFGPDAGILKVDMSGICGSDWGMYNSFPKSKGPLILGHEVVGYVDKLGSVAGKRFGVKEGDRVALEEYLPCGHCIYCRTGDFRLCDQTDVMNFPGVIRYGSTPVAINPGLWGGYSQYEYLHPDAVFHHLPDSLPTKLATLALPIGNGIEWIYRQGGVRIGDAVVIQGPGQQGLACAVAAKEAGAAIIIVTGLSTPNDQARLELAMRLGATHTIMVDKQDLLETVADITGGHMADVVGDCASGGPETVTSALQIARKNGTVVLGGMKKTRLNEFDSNILIRRFLTLKGMRGHSYEAVELAIGLIASKKYPLEEMCTHTFGLADVDEGLRTIGGEGQPGAIHVVIDPNR